MKLRIILFALPVAAICIVVMAAWLQRTPEPEHAHTSVLDFEDTVEIRSEILESSNVDHDLLEDLPELAQKFISGNLSSEEFSRMLDPDGIEEDMMEVVRSLENPEAHFNPLTFAEQERKDREEMLRFDAYELAEWQYESVWAGFVDGLNLPGESEDRVRNALVEFEAREAELLAQFNEGQVGAVEVTEAISKLGEVLQGVLLAEMPPDQVAQLLNRMQRAEAEFDLQVAREDQSLLTSGHTDIVAAAGNDDFPTVQAYLNSGADPNSADTLGVSVLHKAASKGNVSMVEALIAAGADVNPLPTGSEIGSPLIFAATAGRAEAVRILIEAGADLEYYRSFPADTALARAAQAGSTESVRILLEAGADATRKAGEWALIDAIRFHDREMEQMLLDAGANGSALRVVEQRAFQEAGRKLGYVRD